MSVDQPEAVVENLRQERLNVQKKTFTKWANVHLQKHGLFIDDLFVDLGDGVKLMRLLESLTGEKLGKPAKGSARINKIENVSRCLAFLHSKKMRLENISSEDIVDGKPHLILGLLWTIILRCEIWQHQQNVNNLEEQRPFVPQPQDQTHFPVQKIAKDSLLLWCKTKTDGDGRRTVWRKPKTALDPKSLRPTVKHGGGSVMVWGCMASTGHDNAPKHKAHNAKMWHLFHWKQQLHTPPQSPDINFIENLWAILETVVQKHNIRNKAHLNQVLQEEWGKISSDATKKLVESVPRRLEAIIKTKGHATKC
ncbi:Spectrin beta chain [Araneus ventricosus]|uniref:Spectrin beta chain n=1 Tax=Araneus ventricosus TaxID=182803 RepID=A0A4Y2AJP5_ARAVE|nr:Spectrin beta chain [Araneus ventricosus]